MKEYLLEELAEYLGVSIEGSRGQGLGFRQVSTDTRSITPGSLFIALIGERFDAHDYLAAAAEAGAAAFIISDRSAADRLSENHQRPWLLVPDTSRALNQTARWYRGKITGHVIGITGSVGKTSTREMVMAALSRSLKVAGTRANLNNHIGLANTILATDEQTAALVVEMGIDHPGDMLRLTSMAEPDIAIITGIGVSHIANFKTREGILAAKTQITEGLKPGGWLLLNGDNDLLSSFAYKLKNDIDLNGKQISYQLGFVSALSEPDRNLPGRLLFARQIRSESQGSTYDCWEKLPGQEPELWISGVKLPAPGRHQILNSLFGLLAADILGVRAEAARDGLADFVVTGNRQRLVEAAGVTLINDSYNASPESMRAALELLQTLGGSRRKIAVLGGMNELGDLEETLHFQLGLDVARAGVDQAWICGPFASHVERGIHSLIPDCPAAVFADREELTEALIPQVEDHDILLIKGSRTFEMEKVAEAIVHSRLPEEYQERN